MLQIFTFIYCNYIFLDDWNPSLENICSISSHFGFQRLKFEVAESLMSSIFPLESVDRRISSNLQKTYCTYNDVSPSVRTGEDRSTGSTSFLVLRLPGCEQGHSTCDLARQVSSMFWDFGITRKR